jgi:hypothetical protein
MARVIALVSAPHRPDYLEALRICIVCGCAIALILAGPALSQ